MRVRHIKLQKLEGSVPWDVVLEAVKFVKEKTNYKKEKKRFRNIKFTLQKER
jgi:hypothetical protein